MVTQKHPVRVRQRIQDFISWRYPDSERIGDQQLQNHLQGLQYFLYLTRFWVEKSKKTVEKRKN